MKWNDNDLYDTRIEGIADWRPVDQYRQLEDRAGVYIFADEDFDVQYVGKAGAGRMVIEGQNIVEIASAIARLKTQGATQVLALYTNSNEKAKSLERSLIATYDPPNNGVDLLKG